MTARLQEKARGTASAGQALKPYKRGDYIYVPYAPMGFNFDHPADELGPEVWSDGQGMLTRNDAMERQGGEVLLTDECVVDPQYLLSNQISPDYYWLYPGANGVGLWTGTQHHDISPDTPAVVAADSWKWTGGNLNNLAVLNQGEQSPWYWDGNPGNIMLELPGWPAATSCAAMRPFKSYLMAMNMSEPGGNFTTQVRWSNAADPGGIPDTWIPAPENDAGDAILAATPGDIVDGLALRDAFVIYKQHSTYLAQFVGGQFIFIFRKILVTSGMLSRNCVTEYLGRHICLTDGDVVLFDGQNAHSLLQDRLKRWLFQQISGDNFETSFVVSYASQSEVWVCFPETGHDTPNLAAIWDTTTDSWSVRELHPETSYIGRGIIPDTDTPTDWDSDDQAWDLDTTTWNQSAFNPTNDGLLGAITDTPNLIELDVGDLHWDGTTITANISKQGMIIDQAGNYKTVVAVWPKIDAPGDVVIDVRVGTQANYGEAIDWGPSIAFDPKQDLKVDVLASGRLLSVQFASVSPSRWRLKGFAYEVAGAGEY